MQFKQNEFLQQFTCVSDRIDDFYHEIAQKQGLSDSAYAILQAMLVLGNGCTQAEICRYSYLNKQTVNSSVKNLKKNGIVEFKKGTGREVELYLTAEGEKLVQEKVLPYEQAENEVFAEMTPQEQQEILRLTEKYLTALKQKVKHMEEGE